MSLWARSYYQTFRPEEVLITLIGGGSEVIGTIIKVVESNQRELSIIESGFEGPIRK